MVKDGADKQTWCSDSWQIKGKANKSFFSKVLGHHKPPEELRYTLGRFYKSVELYQRDECHSS